MALATIKPEMKSCGQGARSQGDGGCPLVQNKNGEKQWETKGNHVLLVLFYVLFLILGGYKWVYLYVDRLPRA